MDKKFVPLATQLHEGRKICLSKLNLYGLYESTGLASQDLKQKTNIESLHVGGPIWLLQLWLNATVEPSLKTNIPPNSEVGIEGQRLAQITPDDGKVVFREVFETYFNMFYRCKTFISTMTPFFNRHCGLEWFQPFSMWAKLTSSKSGIRANAYQPNLVAR